MNFMHTFYPSLLRIPGFLVEFITPIIKVITVALPYPVQHLQRRCCTWNLHCC